MLRLAACLVLALAGCIDSGGTSSTGGTGGAGTGGTDGQGGGTGNAAGQDGSGGQGASGGGGGTGFGGSGNAAGSAGPPPMDCCAIQKAYNETFAKSLACDPAAADQCAYPADLCIGDVPSTCKAWLNHSEAQALRKLFGTYEANNCFDLSEFPLGRDCGSPIVKQCVDNVKAYYGGSCSVAPKGGRCDPGTKKCVPVR